MAPHSGPNPGGALGWQRPPSGPGSPPQLSAQGALGLTRQRRERDGPGPLPRGLAPQRSSQDGLVLSRLHGALAQAALRRAGQGCRCWVRACGEAAWAGRRGSALTLRRPADLGSSLHSLVSVSFSMKWDDDSNAEVPTRQSRSEVSITEET